MTRRSKREVDQALADIEDQSTAAPDVQDFWKRSAAGENPLDDEEYAEKVAQTVEKHGWPEQWSP